MFVCLVEFKDLTRGLTFHEGDEFNADGVELKRLYELLSPFNALGKPIIRYVDREVVKEEVAEEKPKATKKAK